MLKIISIQNQLLVQAQFKDFYDRFIRQLRIHSSSGKCRSATLLDFVNKFPERLQELCAESELGLRNLELTGRDLTMSNIQDVIITTLEALNDKYETLKVNDCRPRKQNTTLIFQDKKRKEILKDILRNQPEIKKLLIDVLTPLYGIKKLRLIQLRHPTYQDDFQLEHAAAVIRLNRTLTDNPRNAPANGRPKSKYFMLNRTLERLTERVSKYFLLEGGLEIPLRKIQLIYDQTVMEFPGKKPSKHNNDKTHLSYLSNLQFMMSFIQNLANSIESPQPPEMLPCVIM